MYEIRPGQPAAFVFLGNYARFFSDPVALRSLGNTLLYTVVNLCVCLAVGVAMAVILSNLRPRVGNALRAIFSMPLFISPIIVALIWRYMYDPQYGFIYWALGEAGLQEHFGGLNSSAWALFCVALADAWNTTPFILLVVSAGLTVVPPDLYEAAKIDGAGPVRIMFQITLPLLAKVLAVVTLIRGTDAFRVFDLVYGMTNGGPANSTSTLSLYAYKAAYQNNELGYGMAISVITLVALVVLFGPLMRGSARGKED
ncbi:MAG: sugar ABC transporter permease [Bifidobacteriaceae bacterium]|nr:sugar ABC transporter permease [Bifidobacteriaceae bacterium]